MPQFLFARHDNKTPGLLHAESFFTMNLGAPVLSPPRYNLKTVAWFAWWSEERALETFLEGAAFLNEGWHVRMKLYRRWGEISEIKSAVITPELASPANPTVAVTLARLKIAETRRFTKWGKPVEHQVRNHEGQRLALACFRPLNTFSTFSIWRNEDAMVDMVRGRNHSGESHRLAMQERARKDFHHEFTTMRFHPFKEVGQWNGRSDYISPAGTGATGRN